MKLLTASEFGAKHGLSASWVRRRCKSGLVWHDRKCICEKSDGHWLIPEEATIHAKLPKNFRELKTRRQKKFLASCKSVEDNLERASPFRNATITIDWSKVKW